MNRTIARAVTTAVSFGVIVTSAIGAGLASGPAEASKAPPGGGGGNTPAACLPQLNMRFGGGKTTFFETVSDCSTDPFAYQLELVAADETKGKTWYGHKTCYHTLTRQISCGLDGIEIVKKDPAGKQEWCEYAYTYFESNTGKPLQVHAKYKLCLVH